MSFNDCVTQEDQNVLLAIRDGLDMLQWKTGDIANQTQARNQDKYSLGYTCAAVGYFVGKSGATVMRWARASAFYAPEVRERYKILSMEHFITAMGFADWQERLERAANGGFNEEPMSVSQMNAETYCPPISPDNFTVPPTAVVSFDTSVPSVQILGKPDNTIQTILGLIGRLADALNLDEGRRSKVYRAMQLLNEVFMEKEIANG